MILDAERDRVQDSGGLGPSGERVRPRIVGGMFGMEPGLSHRATRPPFLGGRSVTLANARSGIRIVTDFLSSGRVWLPSFLCAAVLAGIADHRRVRFYGIGHGLEVQGMKWVEEVRPGDVVLLIDYFGFPCDLELCAAIHAQGAWVLEDASQALLSDHVGKGADFVVFSPRKTVAVPDGGVLTFASLELQPSIDLQPPPGVWALKSLEAFILRREFEQHGGERHFFPLFQEADREAPAGPWAMGGLSRLLLEHGFDYESIGQRRRENYRVLAKRLGHLAIFPELPERVVPLGFPIWIAERDRFRKLLFAHEIFPPVHWPLTGIVPREFEESHRLAAQCMTLVCDQRYSPEDMERTCEVILRRGGPRPVRDK